MAPERPPLPPVPPSAAAGLHRNPFAPGPFFKGGTSVPMPVTPQSGLEPTSGTANSPGPSSLVTDANSPSSVKPRMQQSASGSSNPSSPPSFSSNTVDGSSVPRQRAPRKKSQDRRKEPGNSSNPRKKPKVEPTQDYSLQQQQQQQQQQKRQEPQQKPPPPPPILQSMQQREIPQVMKWEEPPMPQMQQGLMHQLPERQVQQQRQPQIFPPMTQVPQGQLNRQLYPPRNSNLQSHDNQPATNLGLPLDSGLCEWRLRQYMLHLRQRPTGNSILYWRKFVEEFYAPQAKKRWCFSSYDDVPGYQAIKKAWECDICGAKSGKGFEATSQILPRLSQIEFNRGVIDQLFFLKMPHEYRFPSGIIVLEYAKVAQETIYELQRVVHEGRLRIVFTPDLKILSWEFCVQGHEEFFPRRFLVPQVNNLFGLIQKYQTVVTDNGSAGLSPQELQNFCNMFMATVKMLARSLESQSLNGLGLSGSYMRCLQMSESANWMEDLFDFSQEHKIGPLESLKNYFQQSAARRQRLTRISADLNHNQFPPGPGPNSNLVLQNNSTSFSQVSQQLKLPVVQHLQQPMLSNTNRATGQSLGATSASVKCEAASGRGVGNTGGLPATPGLEFVRNGSGSGSSRTNMLEDNKMMRKIPSGKCDLKSVANGDSNSRIDDSNASAGGNCDLKYAANGDSTSRIGGPNAGSDAPQNAWLPEQDPFWKELAGDFGIFDGVFGDLDWDDLGN